MREIGSLSALSTALTRRRYGTPLARHGGAPTRRSFRHWCHFLRLWSSFIFLITLTRPEFELRGSRASVMPGLRCTRGAELRSLHSIWADDGIAPGRCLAPRKPGRLGRAGPEASPVAIDHATDRPVDGRVTTRFTGRSGLESSRMNLTTVYAHQRRRGAVIGGGGGGERSGRPPV